MIPERELTSPVILTDRNGRLNPDAVGWSRHPLHDTSGIGGRRGWGRNKRWEYWSVVTPTHLISVTVAAIDYAGLSEVWLFDRRTGTEHQRSALTPLGRGMSLAPSLGAGPSSARTRNLAVDLVEVGDGTNLRLRIPGVHADLRAGLPAGHESLGVVVPWSSKRFQYTVKDVGRPVSGTLTIDGEVIAVDGDAWGVLDHGRGRWPYDVRWQWGAGGGIVDGRVIGLQLGGRWTDGTGATENALLIDGRLHRISEELRWEFDRSDYLAPWRVLGRRVHLTLQPFHNKVSSTNVGLVQASTNQCFGTWSGWVLDDRDRQVRVDGVVGFAEDVHNRW